MFGRKPEHKAVIVEKSNELAEEVATRVHELSKQAERQAATLVSRVKKPTRRSRRLRVIGWTALLVPTLGAVAYAGRRFLETKRSVATAPSHSATGAPNPAPSASPAVTLGDVAFVPERDPITGRVASPLAPQTISGPNDLEGRIVAAQIQRDQKDFTNLMGKDVVDVDGKKIGEANGVYYRESASEPEWILVALGTESISPAPLEGATIGEQIELIYPEDLVKNAPEGLGDILDVDDEMTLYGHYSARRTLPAAADLLDNDPLRRWTSNPD